MIGPADIADRVADNYQAASGKGSARNQAEFLLPWASGCFRRSKWTEFPFDQVNRVLDRSVLDIDDIVENHLGVRLEIVDLSHLDRVAESDVFGCAYPDEEVICIDIRALDYMPLYRATLAHELGHIILHSSPRNQTLNYAPWSRLRPALEREADQFMSQLLLPESVFVLGVYWVCALNKMNPALVMAGANSERGRFLWKERVFRALSDRLCVSRAMLRVLARRTGWFSEDTYQYHDTYSLKTKWWHPLTHRSDLARDVDYWRRRIL